MSFDRKGFYREVGLRLRLHRERAELTQEELANVLEMPRSTYANIERGRQRAPADVLWRVAVHLGLSVKDFLPRPVEDPQRDRDGNDAQSTSVVAVRSTDIEVPGQDFGDASDH